MPYQHKPVQVRLDMRGGQTNSVDGISRRVSVLAKAVHQELQDRFTRRAHDGMRVLVCRKGALKMQSFASACPTAARIFAAVKRKGRCRWSVKGQGVARASSGWAKSASAPPPPCSPQPPSPDVIWPNVLTPLCVGKSGGTHQATPEATTATRNPSGSFLEDFLRIH